MKRQIFDASFVDQYQLILQLQFLMDMNKWLHESFRSVAASLRPKAIKTLWSVDYHSHQCSTKLFIRPLNLRKTIKAEKFNNSGVHNRNKHIKYLCKYWNVINLITAIKP